MKLALVVFRSGMSAAGSVEETHAELLAGLRKRFDVSLLSPGDAIGGEGLAVAFIASGGSERSFIDYYPRLPQPLFLLTDGLANSLAAALEILAWIRESGGRAEILHGSADRVASRIEAAASASRARARLSSARVGSIGSPSDWLISSSVDRAAARERWGTAFVDIEMGELNALIRTADGAEAERTAAAFSSGASAIREPGKGDIAAAARVYVALRKLASERGLDALTLKCFDVIGTHGTTGCLALALLNQEGVVAGCEGDQRSAFTMLLARELTGEIPFMANPARVDAESGTAIFAHCTIAPRMSRSYAIRSHFESGVGVGVQGFLEEGPVTVLKVGGASLGRYFLSAGAVTGNLDDPRCCRTQIMVSLKEDASYFLRSPLSNHHIIIRGDHTERLASFLDGEGLERAH